MKKEKRRPRERIWQGGARYLCPKKVLAVETADFCIPTGSL
jgi:hypothetical protein